MDKDERFMLIALEEAKKAEDDGEVPVGAVLVEDEKIIARGHNTSVSDNDPTAHAEIIVIRKACIEKQNYRLSGCDLYVTLEPCAMCIGAAVQARIDRLIFGAPDLKSGAVQSVMEFPFGRMNHHIAIKSGVLADECGKILRGFFKKKR